jgi:hypothetical protein
MSTDRATTGVAETAGTAGTTEGTIGWSAGTPLTTWPFRLSETRDEVLNFVLATDGAPEFSMLCGILEGSADNPLGGFVRVQAVNLTAPNRTISFCARIELSILTSLMYTPDG